MGRRSATQKQCDRTLFKALKYQNYEIARSICLKLIEHYIYYGKEHRLKEINEKFEYINHICEQEKKIRILYGNLTMCKEINDNLILMYKTELNNINNQDFDSYIFKYFYYSINLIICKNDEYEGICNEAIDYFTNLKFDHIAHISIFRNRLVIHKISQEEFVKTKLILIVFMKDHRPFTYHWYLYAVTYVRVLLYSGDNREAYNWYHKVRDSRNYITLPKDHRSECEVLGMYVYLMMTDIDRINIRKVKYNLNYNRTDRSKNHINFLIAEIMYYIQIGNTDIDKKVNHLQKIGKGNKRVTALCNTLKTGKKYAPGVEASFEDEIVQHERLLSFI